MDARKPGEESLEIVVPEEVSGVRLDRFLADRLSSHDLSRSRIQALIKAGHITIDGALAKPRLAVEPGMRIAVTIPEPRPADPQPEDLPLAVLHEDEDIIVVDKAPGMVVHPAAGNQSGTLVNALLHHCPGGLSEIGDAGRPGIVHRLDKDTSGCLVAARNDRAHRSLVEQFAGQTTRKIYLAVVQGVPSPPSGTIHTHIARDPHNRLRMAVVEAPMGREAITDYEVTAGAPTGCARLRCRIHTGRTHQIRVHLRHLGHPILGDPIYAHPSRQPVQVDRLMLHAWHLELDHPATGERMVFRAGCPW